MLARGREHHRCNPGCCLLPNTKIQIKEREKNTNAVLLSVPSSCTSKSTNQGEQRCSCDQHGNKLQINNSIKEATLIFYIVTFSSLFYMFPKQSQIFSQNQQPLVANIKYNSHLTNDNSSIMMQLYLIESYTSPHRTWFYVK